ncbi:MAG: nucleoside 2-deoxyribosyltransferase domain-containing protein [Spirochaetota bacterium]
MAEIIKPPHTVPWDQRKSVFLAGTIDNGQSEDWQSSVESSLSHLDILILNPRRDDWDSSWEQSIHNPDFKKQVDWELDGLNQVDIKFFYFAPNSKSPITLLEFGLHADTKNMILVCPEGYWRRGNLEIVAERFSIPLYDSIEQGMAVLLKSLVES